MLKLVPKGGYTMIKKEKLISGILAASMTVAALPIGSVYAGQTLSVNGGGQEIGNEGGYSYELWQDRNGGGLSTMTLGDGATFDCQWNCAGQFGNFLARRGMRFDCTQTYKDIGNIAFDYSVDYNPGSQGSSYLCVYGWTRDPLVEYYIVDNWKNWRPPTGAGPGQGDPIATVEIDGGLYDIYKSERVNKPSIDGDQTFWQYWSVRQEPRSSGVINVAKHFETWESYGLKMGKFYEAALNIEGYESTGSARVTKNEVTLGEVKETEPPTEAQPDADGYYYHASFEDDKDGWESRGDAKIDTTSSVSYKGGTAIAVTGCTDYWNGVARSLSTSVFKPGNEYSFSTMAMQNATASEKFKMTLEYTDASGEKQYDTIAEADGVKGEWVQLQNTAYKIPNDAKGLLLYIETEDTTTDFFIDEAVGGKAGSEYAAEVKPSVLMGDVNDDKAVDLLDVLTLQKYLLGLKATINNETADMSADSNVDVFDLSLLKREVLKKN